ncbi:phosphate--AMP phosphotransferase [Anaerotalea alkaliphila]|uniref:Phosphate--AMP phosphotransferase n=1 Tax=Anaerotalea alkaliphila TaxID=2662126 RepID=A0A7X5HX51_9FIRM|nr:phosphate--AMP phosphotransferase [Anaerotalea alkaliphila]NDL68260.1 phosphate--AMP phosphotransferase [Anaerotalea alkaliphila]
MIGNYDFSGFENPYENFRTSELGEGLARTLRLARHHQVPVLVIVEGWESSGKGHVINELIRELDPRACKVSVFENPTDEERERPFLWRFWRRIPRKGHMAVFDRSFYFQVMHDLEKSRKSLERDIGDISSIERELYDDDMVVVKFFLHQKEKTQKKRIEELRKDPDRLFLLSERDEAQYDDYQGYLEHFDRILKQSDFPFSPWHVVSTEDQKSAAKMVIGLVEEKVREGIDRKLGKANGGRHPVREYVLGDRPLDRVDLGLSLEESDYEKELKKLQLEARKVAYRMYTKGIPGILVFEGMDAAGKGGAIARLTRWMDPRGYEVVSTAAPDGTERQYHYLWRFYRDFPGKGRIAIFDRSWYGRVMVERIEGFAAMEEWDRAYGEINDMERHLANAGALVLKFFLYIDKDEQLRRFEDRTREPDKVHKITDEDWRNREKWDAYLDAMNEMLVRTDTSWAPWIIVEGQDKRHARVKVLKEFIRQGEKMLEEKG